MSMQEALVVAQQTSHDMLVDQYDQKHGIPMRADSHTDLWPGDRWAEAYIAAGEPEIASAVMHTVARSIREDGAFPHLMQGSHMRGGIETRWIDRQVYRMQGNGAERTPAGEWVTKSFAPPTQALSALAIVKNGLELPEGLTPETLDTAADALKSRRTGSGRLLKAEKVDELTNSAGELAAELKRSGPVADPAINAFSVLNDRALIQLLRHYNLPVDASIRARERSTEYGLRDSFSQAYRDRRPLSNEEVLAAARLGGIEAMAVMTSDRLAAIYERPHPDDAHPERTHLSLAECIEIARLTPHAEASHDFLNRVLTNVAVLGAAAVTRFEGVTPGANPAANKYGRRQRWLPTAAEIVQINPNQY